MKYLRGPMQSWWDDLGQPTLTPELQQRLVDGVLAEAGGRAWSRCPAEPEGPRPAFSGLYWVTQL